MQLFSLTVGNLEENCYFLVHEDRSTLIFDPGDEAEEIKKIIEDENMLPIAILLTHAHGDHIGAVDDIRDAYNIPVYIHEIEKDFLIDSKLNLSMYTGHPISCRPADYFYPAEMGEFKVGNFKMELAHIPGHSPGSTVFMFKENGFVIGGDVLFKGSVGRSDFPGGSHRELMSGIEKYLVHLPGETVVFSGHGEPTTIQQEIDTNPYLNGATR